MSGSSRVAEVWVYLHGSPLLWLTVTLVAYLVGDTLFRKSGANPSVNPVAIAAVLLGCLLLATGTTYDDYFEGAQFVHFLLGPAIVALAVPLFANVRRIRKAMVPVLFALISGSLTAIVTAVVIARYLGVSDEAVLSLYPKSVTTPIAMGISEKIGGLPSLTAGMVILTGIVGAVIVTPLMNLFGFDDWRARGFAVGVASHGIGTARAFQVNEVAGVFAAVAMALNGLVTALIIAILVHWL